ncbi:3-deoxy-8-phosphooctulonate synthase [Halothermothrix orenii]|uniref:2-dehydro-3-deoxyphosphooctonate aldolase n=1 Tax=Halothermothrix orenii (strain H 168 / OCM 544 / DSM 9562) TaxID=373903 RepID=B8CZC1_HALOH|nr:2-dehydro-3-deoxyphosphooctonate aldolase [Halothermothrix orenii H 168]
MLDKVKKVKLNQDIVFGDSNRPLVLIAGPCVLEEEDRVLKIAETVKEITSRLGIPYVFKSSYDKANRSSIKSFRGPGLEDGLKLLERVKREVGVPLLTDVHEPDQAALAAEVVDIVQIPAFLSRQTDLVVAAGRTGKIVNVKKGQFLAPWDIDRVVEKIESTGNEKILLTERGVSFGYNNLVVDMRSLPRMRETGYPVVFDATHSVQLPGGAGETSGGDRKFVPYLTRAAVGTGVDALFMEVHDNPDVALSDGPNMVPLDQLEGILIKALAIDEIVKGR